MLRRTRGGRCPVKPACVPRSREHRCAGHAGCAAHAGPWPYTLRRAGLVQPGRGTYARRGDDGVQVLTYRLPHQVFCLPSTCRLRAGPPGRCVAAVSLCRLVLPSRSAVSSCPSEHAESGGIRRIRDGIRPGWRFKSCAVESCAIRSCAAGQPEQRQGFLPRKFRTSEPSCWKIRGFSANRRKNRGISGCECGQLLAR